MATASLDWQASRSGWLPFASIVVLIGRVLNAFDGLFGLLRSTHYLGNSHRWDAVDLAAAPLGVRHRHGLSNAPAHLMAIALSPPLVVAGDDRHPHPGHLRAHRGLALGDERGEQVSGPVPKPGYSAASQPGGVQPTPPAR
ncbi:MAG TPA: hypothetical protein VKY90_13535 [Candidatus Dormibacteraeota bacterium]|nr:hypothetical protein [Candidatus Dormibacteraeota bacterium]